MVVINAAYTEQINPPGVEPLITRAQIWEAMQHKIRHPQGGFVPVILDAEVLEDKDGVVKRVAWMRVPGDETGTKRGEEVRETCKSYYPTKVDFWRDNGDLVTNTISDGPGLSEHEMLLTYTFSVTHEGVQEGSEEHKRLSQQQIQGAKNAVHASIVMTRELVKKGELKG